nr:immunoglobulin light chain junction region [Macaca mulatta]MOV64852.1 immunoglobulin light chain junction region [Macaca mulatta]MOW39702.1 immunoglobulin light chain junction region [Macaca mulatta]MOW39749.1 immunoglobulin light chain junction region [Macaca mulatta]MOX27216.1 immunoglobulin light chain junction region [Macaca mulatta]
CLQYNSYPYSF